MLEPPQRKPSHPVPGPLRHSLLGSVVMIGATALSLFIVWAVTHWLSLVVHQGLH